MHETGFDQPWRLLDTPYDVAHGVSMRWRNGLGVLYQGAAVHPQEKEMAPLSSERVVRCRTCEQMCDGGDWNDEQEKHSCS